MRYIICPVHKIEYNSEEVSFCPFCKYGMPPKAAFTSKSHRGESVLLGDRLTYTFGQNAKRKKN